MEGVTSISDYRDDMFVSLFRRWLVVDQLGKNRKGDPVLSIQKGALFDFLLKNPKDMHAFLVYFKRLNHNSPYVDVLYANDAEFGAYLDVKEFLRSMLALEAEGYVQLSEVCGEYFVCSGNKRFEFESELVEGWKLSLLLLKPIVGKSLNVLQKNSLG